MTLEIIKELRNLKILIVEDNPAHLKILQYVLNRNKFNANYYYAHDGQEALNFLYKTNSFASQPPVPTPDLILLDLNLPKRDGREVLQIVKENVNLKEIPVVIVSTSDREEDLNFAFSKGAVAYISKSVGFETFKNQIAEITKYAKK